MSPFHALTLAAEPGATIVLIVTAMLLVVMLVMLVMVFGLVRWWMLAAMAGCRLPLTRVVAMRLRRTNVAEVVQCGVMCQQAGCPIGWDELERAAIMGVDLEKVTLAYIKSQQEELGYTFGDLVDADRDHRLARLLNEGS